MTLSGYDCPSEQPGEQGTGVVPVQGRSSISRKAGRSFRYRTVFPIQSHDRGSGVVLESVSQVSLWRIQRFRTSQGRRYSSQISYHHCFLISFHQNFLLLLSRQWPAIPWLLGLAHWQASFPSHSPPALCCWALCPKNEGWKQVVPVDISSLRCCMTCSAILENCEMASGACPCVWLSMDGRQSSFCSSESCHFHIPRHPYHFLNCMPHPLPPARQAATYLAVLWQILLLVRTVKETHLSGC